MSKRKDSIDAIKGIGILLVILGHTYGIPAALDLFIYSFHMPLFFILAGYLYDAEKYRCYTFKEFFCKKGKAYLVPYYAFAGINLILTMLWHAVILRSPLSLKQIGIFITGTLYCYADMKHMPNCSPIWFLMCLFISLLIFWSVMKRYSEKAGLISFLLMIIAYIISLFIRFRLPFNILTACIGVFFIYIGYLLKNHAMTKCEKLAFFAVFGIWAAFANSQVGMNESFYGNIILFLISSITLSLTLMIACEGLPVLQNRFFTLCGKNTMVVIGFNYFMRDFTTELYYLIPVIRNYHLHWIVSFFMTAIGCMCLIPIEKRIVSKILRVLSR